MAPDNGSGSFAPLSTGFPFVPDTLIDATIMDPLLLDVSSGLSNRICKDGQTSLTAHIPFNGFKATNMAPGTARTDSSTLANIQDGTGVYIPLVSGSANAITLNVTPAIGTYTAGQTFRFLAFAANTAAVTIQVSGLPLPKALLATTVTPLIAGDIRAGDLLQITYDGTQFILGAPPARGPFTNQSLTNALLDNATVTADPTVALGVASKQYVDSYWGTGDCKLTWKTVADAGWILHDDGTIGNAASGATTRAHADTQALYYLLWNGTVDADAPVSGGRSGFASVDYAANKTLRLPLALGRELAISGSGSGLTARALGSSIGTEDAVNISHTHTLTDPTHTHAVTDNNAGGTFDAGNTTTLAGDGSTGAVSASTQAASTGLTVDTSGVSGTGLNISPRFHMNIMIRL